jgi:hypothetical protein
VGELGPFDPNDYRKRVLAAVEKRGGPDASDPFELYDLPLPGDPDGDPDGDLDDAAVAARIEEVWAAWQRQRDHPKYRVLVALLVEQHAERSAELLDPVRRRRAAARVRAERARRDTARHELLDGAIDRLVQRHGGIPADKVDGLYELGALAGLSRAEVDERMGRHRELPRPQAIGPERRRQVRALLDEFGRLTGDAAPPTLLGLLGVGPDATAEQVRAAAASRRARARELPPQRLRAVVDELLVHVAELIEPDRAAVEQYLEAVAADVAEALRPRVRAAVLVEDRLVVDDRDRLVAEALGLGLDRARAAAVIAALAEDLGAAVDGPAPPRLREWEEPLQAARAALAAGRPAQAQRLVLAAEQHAGDDGRTRVRALAAEVEAALAEAGTRWRAVVEAREARRWNEAVERLEELRGTASDVPGPDGEAADDLLRQARAALERADRAVAAALAGPAADRARALSAVLADCPGHPGATAELVRIPIDTPAWVSAVRDTRGDVLVLWAASATPGVEYRVSRRGPDGRWQVLGRTDTTSMDDHDAPVGVEPPVYAVVATRLGRTSVEACSQA